MHTTYKTLTPITPYGQLQLCYKPITVYKAQTTLGLGMSLFATRIGVQRSYDICLMTKTGVQKHFFFFFASTIHRHISHSSMWVKYVSKP
jgi:hypothetical protein